MRNFRSETIYILQRAEIDAALKTKIEWARNDRVSSLRCRATRNRMPPTDAYAGEAPPRQVAKLVGARATSVRARPPRREDGLSLSRARSRRTERKSVPVVCHGVPSPAVVSRISPQHVHANARWSPVMISTETRRAPLPSLLLLCTLVVPTYARSWGELLMNEPPTPAKRIESAIVFCDISRRSDVVPGFAAVVTRSRISTRTPAPSAIPRRVRAPVGACGHTCVSAPAPTPFTRGRSSRTPLFAHCFFARLSETTGPKAEWKIATIGTRSRR